jgi:hypothetical protein
MMVIVKEPGIDVPLAKRGLDGGKIHGQTTILTGPKQGCCAERIRP